MAADHLKILDDNERQPCGRYPARVMGYHRPVSQWNVGKKGEYEERRFFLLPSMTELEINVAEKEKPHGRRGTP